MKPEDYEAFKAWWLASKYNQVVIPAEGWEQIAKDPSRTSFHFNLKIFLLRKNDFAFTLI